ncbi:hypothetical protein D3C78_1342120 [compost metagenome]
MQLVQALLTRIKNTTGYQVRIDGLVHALEHTIGAGEQLLHLRAELLILQGAVELGRTELEGTVFGSVDTQLPQSGQTIPRTHGGQLRAQVAEQCASGRITGQRAQHGLAILVLADGSELGRGLDQGVIGIDEGLNGGLQTFLVLTHGDGNGITRGLEQVQAQTTDSLVDSVGLAGDLQAIDRHQCILGQVIDVTRTRADHLVGTVDLQLGDAVH